VIAETVARFARRQAPAIWWLDPESTPPDLPRRLEAAALRPEETGIVRGSAVADVLARADELLAATTARAAPGRDGVEVRAVREAGDLDHWIEVAQANWGADEAGDLARRRELYLGLGLDPAAALKHWVAVDGDRTVGMATAFSTGPVVLVDHDEVVDQDRRPGAGTALLQAALTEGQRRGCRWAVLEPTPQSASFYDALYDALGFEVERCRPGVEFYLPLESG
jgi:GNAT superfamily N-acetyltransferase